MTTARAWVVVRWGRVNLLDGGLVGLVVLQLLELILARPGAVSVSVVVLTVMGTASLLVRRRSALTATLMCLGSHAALIQLLPSGLSTTFFALLVALAVVGGLPLTVAVTGLVAGVAVAGEGAWLDVYGGGFADFGLSAAVLAAAWLCGLLLARRGRAAVEASARAERAEQRRRRAAKEAVDAERARVTRELHDVVAHGLTVLVVQSVAAQDDIEHGAEAADVLPRLRATEEVARQSLNELRTLLDVLRDEVAEDADRQPPPLGGLAGIEQLVAQTRNAGLEVDLVVDGEPVTLEQGVGLAAYRIVQEGLTNVLKHGRGGATVTVSFDQGGVSVEVLNQERRPTATGLGGSGRGLAGLRERASMFGGTFEAGPVGQGFRVASRLPQRGVSG
jgi:signal transduction histidine kinase